MKNNKVLILIVAIILIIILVVVLKVNKNKDSVVEEENNTNINTSMDDMSGLYEVYDANTNEVLTTVTTEEGAELEKEFYNENPDYRADIPESPNVDVN